MRRTLGFVLRLPRVAAFALWYLAELVEANALVVVEVLRPSYAGRPSIVRVPLRARGAFEITLLANLVSLVPGTLSVDLDGEHRHLYVHGLHVSDPESLRAHVQRLEDRLLRVTRG